jgi:ParB family chromosome partitioning protein
VLPPCSARNSYTDLSGCTLIADGSARNASEAEIRLFPVAAEQYNAAASGFWPENFNQRKEQIMDNKKSRPGRGPNGQEGHENSAVSSQVPVEVIDTNPNQPRRSFDQEDLESLSDSIRNHGVLQPLIVRQVGQRFQLVAGERRLRAARAVGMGAVPVRIVNFNDQQVMEAALVENIQRADLNPIEKAQGFKDYLDRFKMTHEELGQRLGISRTAITNLIGLLDLAPDVQTAVRSGAISMSHAKILKGVTDKARQTALCRDIILKKLSVDATDVLVKQALQPAPKDGEQSEREPRPAVEKTAHVKGIEDELRQKFGARAEIRLSAKDKGQFVVSFESNDEFERILELLRK